MNNKTAYSVGEWVIITGWPKPTFQGVCEINISKVQCIHINEYDKITQHGLTVIMEHEHFINKHSLKKSTNQINYQNKLLSNNNNNFSTEIEATNNNTTNTDNNRELQQTLILQNYPMDQDEEKESFVNQTNQQPGIKKLS